MNDQNKHLRTDAFGRDSYANLQTSERRLNEAIACADFTNVEQCLEVFDCFYDDDIEISSERMRDNIHGKEDVRLLLYGFLFRLHVMLEIGALSMSIQEAPIPGDSVNTTHSFWTVELVGLAGKPCRLEWSTMRKWDRFRIVREHHYDHKQIGGSLKFNDFEINPFNTSHSYH